MSTKITRRAAGKLLLVAAAAAALPGATPAKRPARPRLTPQQRKDYEKTLGQLRKTADAVRAMKIPIGTEPAFVFKPLVPGK